MFLHDFTPDFPLQASSEGRSIRSIQRVQSVSAGDWWFISISVCMGVSFLARVLHNTSAVTAAEMPC